MLSEPDRILDFVIAGQLQRDTILPLKGPPSIDILGGGLAYASAGLAFWGGQAGMLSKISPDFPMQWLEPMREAGFSLEGIRTSHESIDMRWFVAYSDLQTAFYDSPITQFANRGLSVPKEMLNYGRKSSQDDDLSRYDPKSIGISDIPGNYLETHAAHICPINLVSHQVLPNALKRGSVQTVTMSACPGYMDPTYWEFIPSLVSDLTAFMVEEADLRRLFQGRSSDLWEMAASISKYGPEFVLIRMKDGGQYLFDGVSLKKWTIPMYNGNVMDPTGAADAFAGGFLINYRQTYDPVYATLCGNVTASFAMEGCGPFYVLGAMPGLKEARLAALKDLVTQM